MDKITSLFLKYVVRLASIVFGGAFALGYLSFRMGTDLSLAVSASLRWLFHSVSGKGFAIAFVASMIVLAVAYVVVRTKHSDASPSGWIIGGYEKPMFWFMPFVIICELVIFAESVLTGR